MLGREAGVGERGAGRREGGGGKFDLELSIGGCLITSTMLGTVRSAIPHNITGRHKAAGSTT